MLTKSALVSAATTIAILAIAMRVPQTRNLILGA